MEPATKTIFTFEERRADSLEALKTWFYPGDAFGQSVAEAGGYICTKVFVLLDRGFILDCFFHFARPHTGDKTFTTCPVTVQRRAHPTLRMRFMDDRLKQALDPLAK